MDHIKIIDSGFLKKMRGTQPQKSKFILGFLDINHLDNILNLQKIIINSLKNKEALHAFSRDFFHEQIKYKGIILGIFFENDLIAYRPVYYPDADEIEFNFGFDINLPEAEMDKVANFQGVVVHPLFRGNNFGKLLNEHAINILRQTKYRHLFATVHPDNFFNIRILFASGFIIRELKYKYNNNLRYIVYQDLKKNFNLSHKKEKIVKNIEIERQQQLIAEGYYGIGINKEIVEHYEFDIIYTK